MDYTWSSSGFKPLKLETEVVMLHVRELRHKVSLSALHKGRIEINTQGIQEVRTSEKQNKFHG